MRQQIFACKNRRCRKLIPLLFPIVQGTAEDRLASVAGGFRVVIGCPGCGQVHEYLPRDARRGEINLMPPLAFYSVEFHCGHKGCGVLVQFYAVEPVGTNPQVILAKGVAGFFHTTCERGHDFFPAAGAYQIQELKPN